MRCPIVTFRQERDAPAHVADLLGRVRRDQERSLIAAHRDAITAPEADRGRTRDAIASLAPLMAEYGKADGYAAMMRIGDGVAGGQTARREIAVVSLRNAARVGALDVVDAVLADPRHGVEADEIADVAKQAALAGRDEAVRRLLRHATGAGRGILVEVAEAAVARSAQRAVLRRMDPAVAAAVRMAGIAHCMGSSSMVATLQPMRALRRAVDEAEVVAGVGAVVHGMRRCVPVSTMTLLDDGWRDICLADIGAAIGATPEASAVAMRAMAAVAGCANVA